MRPQPDNIFYIAILHTFLLLFILHLTFQFIPLLPTLDRQDLISFILTNIFLHHLSFPLSTASILHTHWILTVLLCPLQLLRKPNWLKDRLRPLRVATGPINILLGMVTGLSHVLHLVNQPAALHDKAALALWIVEILMAAAVAGSALLAGFVFRPDNTAVLGVLVQEERWPPYRRRVEVHATANAVMVLGSIFLIALPSLIN